MVKELLNWPDLINGAFEMFAGGFQALNCLRLQKDKKIRGYSPVAIIFFTSWGFWNLFYYPHLDQWLSFAGGLVIVTVSSWWLILLWIYRNN